MSNWSGGKKQMKIFISWSGDLSKRIADALNKWLPCLLQTIKIFYSPEDIEKGENWDQRIASELSECNYGLICLTSENVSAPWVNFEAGAIAKALGSHVATLMININPSDIKGPLSRYQATKLEKTDFLHLIQDINHNSDSPIEESRLSTTFEGLWSNIEGELIEITKSSAPSARSGKRGSEKANYEAIEEILQLVRKQNSILTTPELLLPREYIDYIIGRTLPVSTDIVENLLSYLDYVYNHIRESEVPYAIYIFSELQLMDFIRSLSKSISRRNKPLYDHYSDIRRKYLSLHEAYGETGSIDSQIGSL